MDRYPRFKLFDCLLGSQGSLVSVLLQLLQQRLQGGPSGIDFGFGFQQLLVGDRAAVSKGTDALQVLAPLVVGDAGAHQLLAVFTHGHSG